MFSELNRIIQLCLSDDNIIVDLLRRTLERRHGAAELTENKRQRLYFLTADMTTGADRIPPHLLDHSLNITATHTTSK